MPYGTGKRCVILSEGKQDVYNAIVFIDQDEGCHITKMTISRNSRYHFQIDEPIAVSDAKVIANYGKTPEAAPEQSPSRDGDG